MEYQYMHKVRTLRCATVAVMELVMRGQEALKGVEIVLKGDGLSDVQELMTSL
jgi:hypothetical protein